MERRSACRGRRPTLCEVCHTPLKLATRGRPRLTCSDRCRQIKRRRDYRTWKDPRRVKQAWRWAEHEVRKIEKALGGPGVLDIPAVPGDTYLTLRKRVLIRLARGEGIPFCQVCGMPYIIDTYRHVPTCKGKCAKRYGEQQRAVRAAIAAHTGDYDPRVDVRVRLGLPIRVCKQCGKPFCVYGGPRQIYCSKRCNNNAWYARHPKRTCKACKVSFRGKGKFCSARCSKHAHYHTALRCARCEHCVRPGSAIPPNEDTRLPNHRKGTRWDRMPVVFCSGRCRDALGWSPSYKRCKGCGELFYPSAKTHQRQQEYCTALCRHRIYRRTRRRAAFDALPPRVCRQCGESFKPDFVVGRSKRVYCSKDCRLEAVKEQKRADRAAKRDVGILVEIPIRWGEWVGVGD